MKYANSMKEKCNCEEGIVCSMYTLLDVCMYVCVCVCVWGGGGTCLWIPNLNRIIGNPGVGGGGGGVLRFGSDGVCR